MGEILDSDWSRRNLLRSDWLPTSVATITTVAVSVVELKALSENLASRNRLLSVDYYLFPY